MTSENFNNADVGNVQSSLRVEKRILDQQVLEEELYNHVVESLAKDEYFFSNTIKEKATGSFFVPDTRTQRDLLKAFLYEAKDSGYPIVSVITYERSIGDLLKAIHSLRTMNNIILSEKYSRIAKSTTRYREATNDDLNYDGDPKYKPIIVVDEDNLPYVMYFTYLQGLRCRISLAEQVEFQEST